MMEGRDLTILIWWTCQIAFILHGEDVSVDALKQIEDLQWLKSLL